MRKLIFLLLGAVAALNAMAQEEAADRINRIKKSKQYLSAEAVMPTVEEATSTAFEHLQDEIALWAQNHCKKVTMEKIIVTDIINVVDTIVHRRANMYRVFTYVSKSNLIPIYKGMGYAIIDPEAKTDVTEERKPQAVVKSEPETRAKDEEAKPEVKEEMTPSEEVKTGENETVAEQDDINEPPTQDISEAGHDVIKQLKELKSFFDLEKVLPRLKEEGKVTGYGKYATMTSPEDSYLIIYDAAGNIRALLGKGDDERTNLKTGEADSTDNYRGCGAIWVTDKR